MIFKSENKSYYVDKHSHQGLPIFELFWESWHAMILLKVFFLPLSTKAYSRNVDEAFLLSSISKENNLILRFN